MTDSNDKKWTTLESRYVVRRPWLTARCERVQLPTGAVHDEYYVLEYPTWVNIIARDENGRFIMVEQYRHGLGEVFTELCAGIAEEGEDPETAALGDFGKSKHTDKPDLLFRGRRRAQDTEPAA